MAMVLKKAEALASELLNNTAREAAPSGL